MATGPIALIEDGPPDAMPVVLVHATVLTSREFDLVPRVERARYLRYERRGCGRTAAPLDSDVPDLLGLLASEGQRAVLVSSADAAAVVLHAAAAAPHLVDSLVLCSPLLPDQAMPQAATQLHEAVRAAVGVDDVEATGELVLTDDHLLSAPLSAGAERLLLDMLTDMVRTGRERPYPPWAALPATWPVIGRVTAPVTVLVGADDSDDGLAAAETLAARLPHGELLVAEGAGRMLPLERPDLIATVLTAAVARRRPRCPG